MRPNYSGPVRCVFENTEPGLGGPEHKVFKPGWARAGSIGPCSVVILTHNFVVDKVCEVDSRENLYIICKLQMVSIAWMMFKFILKFA